jgi:hypothetical protein
MRAFIVPKRCSTVSRRWRMAAAFNVQIAGSYPFERRQVAGAVPNAFLKAREKAASEP